MEMEYESFRNKTMTFNCLAQFSIYSTIVRQDKNRLHLFTERSATMALRTLLFGGIEKAESTGPRLLKLETKQRISPGNPISITITMAGDTRGRQGRTVDAVARDY